MQRKAIEIDPYPGDGKCYFIEKQPKLDYNRPALTAKPYLKRIRGMETKLTSENLAATQFWDSQNKPKQTWRFAQCNQRKQQTMENQTDAQLNGGTTPGPSSSP